MQCLLRALYTLVMQWSSGTICVLHICVFVCVNVSKCILHSYVRTYKAFYAIPLWVQVHSYTAVPVSDPVPSTFPAAQVWMVVQRKWMYLESIFLAGDIRAQLPEEAKKFDVIDKTFKKVTLSAVYLCMRLLCWHICGMNSCKG